MTSHPYGCRGHQPVNLEGIYLRNMLLLLQEGGKEVPAHLPLMKLADINALVVAFLPGQALLPPCGNGSQTGHPPLGGEALGDSSVLCRQRWRASQLTTAVWGHAGDTHFPFHTCFTSRPVRRRGETWRKGGGAAGGHHGGGVRMRG